MRISIDSYKRNKPFVLSWYEKNKKYYTPEKAISVLAVSTLCPCIVIAYWLGEATGWPIEIVDSINTFMKFYKYEEILDKPPGAPL